MRRFAATLLALTMVVFVARAGERKRPVWAHADDRLSEVRELLDAWKSSRSAPGIEVRNARIFGGGPDVVRAVFDLHTERGDQDGTRQLIWRRQPKPPGWRLANELLPAAIPPAPPSSPVDESTPATPSGPRAAAVAKAFLQLAPLFDRDAVVMNQPPDDAWAAGRPGFSSPDKLYRELRRPVDQRKLPPELRALLGQRLWLLDTAGRPVCDAKVTGFTFRGRVTGAPNVINDAWSLAAKTLVATLDARSARCKDAAWARSARLPFPKVAPAVEPDPALAARAIAALRALPAAVELADEEYAYVGRPRAEAGDWMSDPTVRVFAGPSGAPWLLSVTIEAHGLCNEPNYDLWALWELRPVTGGLPDLILRNQPDRYMHVVPTAAADVDGDGKPELLFESFHDDAAGNASGQPQYLEHGLIKALDGDYVDVRGAENPNYVCPC